VEVLAAQQTMENPQWFQGTAIRDLPLSPPRVLAAILAKG
jgi:hypothetical protein